MKFARTLIVLAAIQAAGAAIAAPARAQDDSDDRSAAGATSKLDTTVTISKDGTVDLHLISGEMIVNAGSGNQVRIHAWSERGILQFSSSPSRVSLDVRSNRGRSGDTHYEVTVPVGIRLELKSVSGQITAHGVKGELDVGAVSGDVDVSDGTGHSEIESVSGDIKADRFSGETRVNAVSGDLSLHDITGALEVETVSGEMTLERGSPLGSSWCAVWQSAQSAVTVNPLCRRPLPWMLSV